MSPKMATFLITAVRTSHVTKFHCNHHHHHHHESRSRIFILPQMTGSQKTETEDRWSMLTKGLVLNSQHRRKQTPTLCGSHNREEHKMLTELLRTTLSLVLIKAIISIITLILISTSNFHKSHQEFKSHFLLFTSWSVFKPTTLTFTRPVPC
jgi:undecaprenyl pyrophosphate synthase